MKQVIRFHPLLVLLHWILAVLIVAMLAYGYFGVAATANSDPHKIGLLRLHMATGMAILALMLVRLIVRLLTAEPPRAMTGHAGLDRIAWLGHYGFYLLVVLMAATGLVMAVQSGLNLIVFGGSKEPIPPSLSIYPSHTLHGLFAALLALMIVLHTVAALYHHLIRRDSLLRRMSFGRRFDEQRGSTGFRATNR